MLRWLRWRRHRRPPRRLRTRIARACAKLLLVLLVGSAAVVASLRLLDPPTTSFMLIDRMTAEGAGDRKLRHYWVPYAQIAPAARAAVIAAEDQRFYEHHGFDLDSIVDAAYERVMGERERGASTISQQVAKNLFLWPGPSFARKGLEAYFTVLIELLWPKQRILEVYLNVAQFGRGVFGIEAASVTFFQRPAAELTTEQAATLAAVLPNPVRYRADRPSAYVEQRSRWIVSQIRMLRRDGRLTGTLGG